MSLDHANEVELVLLVSHRQQDATVKASRMLLISAVFPSVVRVPKQLSDLLNRATRSRHDAFHRSRCPVIEPVYIDIIACRADAVWSALLLPGLRFRLLRPLCRLPFSPRWHGARW